MATPTGSGGATAIMNGSVPNGFMSSGVQQPAPQGGQSPFGTVTGPNVQSAGANGVTSYGLFSAPNAQGAQAPTRQPVAPSNPPAPTSPYRGTTTGVRAPSPNGTIPPQYGAGGTGIPPPPPLQSGFQGGAGGFPRGGFGQGMQGMPLPQNLASAFGQFRGGSGGGIPPANTMQQLGGGQSFIGGAPQGSQQMRAFDTSGSNNTVHSIDPATGQRNDGHTGQDPPDNSNGQGAGSPAANAINGFDSNPIGSAINGVAGGVGGALGSAFADATSAWDKATGGGGNGPSDLNMTAGAMPGFQDSGLTNAVTQNAMTMMDPAAWQQMAQNQLQQANATNTASLNLGTRRLADMQGRTGLADIGGAMGNLFHQYGLQGAADQRNIFNDSLNNQMNAANVANNLALGERGQDLSRWNALAGQAGQAAGQDFGAYRQDHPSGAAFFQDMMGGLGQLAGGASGGIGSILAALLKAAGPAAAVAG